MAEITAALVKELRDKSGAGMMDCKKALTETDGDLDAAAGWLRTKGLAAAAKKAGRVAAEGLVGVAVEGRKAVVLELNSETDFVARNDQFQAFLRTLADLAIAREGMLDDLLAAPFPGGDRTVAEEVTQMVAAIGENLTLRRLARVSVDEGVVASYVHNAVADGMGKIGVIVGLKSSADPERLQALGRQLAMHIAAAQPQAVRQEDLSQDAVEKERAILLEQARESGRPADIIQKMVEGRLRKFYEETVLLNQTWVIDGERKVHKVIEEAAKELGAPVEVADFARFALGEGIERTETDFAAEVAAQVAG